MTAPELRDMPDALGPLLAVAQGGDAKTGPALDDTGWAQVPAMARAHRMQGLLYRAIAAAGWMPPDAVRREVAADARAVARQSLQHVAVVRSLVDAAAARGIPLLPYKGPVLSLLAYGDLALRPAADVDILVPCAHAASASVLMQSCGYAPATGLAEPLHRRMHAHLGASPWQGAGGLVELHWRLCELGLPWSIDAGELLDRASWRTIAGREVPVPAIDDLLLMLAWHGARHAWEQLEWLAALAALTRAHRPDWTALAVRAGAHGGRRAVILAQALLAHWLGVAEPPPSAPWLEEARRLVGAQYVRGTTLFVHDRACYRRFLRLLLERPSDRVRLMGAHLLLPTALDARWLPVPPALWPMYVPVRLVRLTLRAAGLAHDGEQAA